MRPDTIDAASELEELQRQAAIQAHRIDRNAVSATHCDECGDEIEEAWRHGCSRLPDVCELPG